jgi:hypothetical protein
MNKNNFARKFCLFLEILSILCLFFFVWIIFSDWSNANIDPASASGADQPATGSMPGKGFAIFMFITCLNGNVLTILLFWFPHLSWRGKTIFEILYRQKDNRNEFERQFQQLLFTVGKTGITWSFAILTWQSMLVSQGKVIAVNLNPVLAIIFGTVALTVILLIYYVIVRYRQEKTLGQ